MRPIAFMVAALLACGCTSRRYMADARHPEVVVTDRGQLEFCAAGEGKVPFAEVIALLRQLSFEGFISVYYKGSEEPADGVKRCAENLKKLLSE